MNLTDTPPPPPLAPDPDQMGYTFGAEVEVSLRDLLVGTTTQPEANARTITLAKCAREAGFSCFLAQSPPQSQSLYLLQFRGPERAANEPEDQAQPDLGAANLKVVSLMERLDAAGIRATRWRFVLHFPTEEGEGEEAPDRTPVDSIFGPGGFGGGGFSE